MFLDVPFQQNLCLNYGLDIVFDPNLLILVLSGLLKYLLRDIAIENILAFCALLVYVVQGLCYFVFIEKGSWSVADRLELGNDFVVILHELKYNILQYASSKDRRSNIEVRLNNKEMNRRVCITVVIR